MMRSSLVMVLVALSLGLNRGAAAETQELPKPASRTAKSLYGWTVQVDDRLLTTPNDQLGSRALKMLEAKLSDIEFVVAKDRLEKLKSVTIVLDLTHGRLRAMQYHPSAPWLEEHGYSKELAKCVHIPEAADFAKARQVNEQPWVVLHELAHAYHDASLDMSIPVKIWTLAAQDEADTLRPGQAGNESYTDYTGKPQPCDA